mgnify:CR=1 FL=1
MPTPRKAQISLQDTPYYHCVSRCVRRGFLCGEDKVSKKNYEYRRKWLEDRLVATSQMFAIDICAYAIMDNHFHLVLHVDEEQAKDWSTEQVLHHWHKEYKGTLLTQRYIEKKPDIHLKLTNLKLSQKLIFLKKIINGRGEFFFIGKNVLTGTKYLQKPIYCT